jgi:protein TonB
MKNQIGHTVPTYNLKIFLLISMNIHLLLCIVLILIPDIRIEKLPNMNVEVSLLPVIGEEKPSPKIIPPKLKTEFKGQESRPSRTEKREEPLQKELEPEPHLSMQAEEPKSSPKQKEVEKSETEYVSKSTAILLPAQSNLSSEKVASIAPPSYPAFGSKDLDGTLLPKNIGSREGSGTASKLPFPSDGDITFTQPKYAVNPKPLYPQEAREKGYQGEVMLRVEVLTNGQVGQVEVKKSSGYELLDRSASATVKQWKFIPAKKGSEAIPFWVNIPIKFQLQ